MKDPQFVADAKRLDIDVRPTTGPEADALGAQVYATPPEIVRAASEFKNEAQ